MRRLFDGHRSVHHPLSVMALAFAFTGCAGTSMGPGGTGEMGAGGNGTDAQASGSGGASGSAGSAGSGGSGGASGAAGSVGSGGSGGASGSAGSAGAGGSGGASGSAGSSGTFGSAGSGGGSPSDAGAMDDGAAGGAMGKDGGTDASVGPQGDGGASTGGIVAAGVRWMGRVDTSDSAGPRFAWSGSGFVAQFSGTSLDAKMNNSDAFVFKPVIDGVAGATFVVTKGQSTKTLATGLAAGMHTVALYRQTEGSYGDSQLLGLTVGGGALAAPPAASGRLIEVVGDSISCGYGNGGTIATCPFSFDTERHWDAYESVAARALNAEVSTVAYSGRGMYRNYDGSITTGTMPTLYDRALTNSSTAKWGFKMEPQVVVINLGTNDFNAGDPGAPFETAYTAFLATVRSHYAKALIVCTIGPMVGDDNAEMHLTKWRGHVNAVITARHNAGDDKVFFLEFPTQTTAQAGCDYHPNVAKHKLMGDSLAAFLKTQLPW